MDITEEITIPAPLGVVWPLLRDPAVVAGCIPGAQLAPDQGDGVWRGQIRVKFGPTVAIFRGEAKLSFDDAAHRCTIEGRGIDGRGASRALSQGVFTATDAGAATRLTVAGSFTVTGPLETFANAGGVHLARALLAEFSTNMAAVVAAQPAPEVVAPVVVDAAAPVASTVASPAGPPAPPPAPAAELGGFRLLWLAFLSWLRSLARPLGKH